MFDIDGVRCWLPCLDLPDQRAIFDITIHAPVNTHIVTCGKRLLTTTRMVTREKASNRLILQSFADGFAINVHSKELFTQQSYTASRFFTTHRTAAAYIGFYVGKAEAYQMPFYKVRARLLVALDLWNSLDKPDVQSPSINKIANGFFLLETRNS